MAIESYRGGIYVHIPFCRRKCIYCDFYSVAVRLADWRRYMDAILAELTSRQTEFKSFREVTVYLGGGTPSLIPANEFMRLAEGMRDALGEIRVREFTIEVNPDDVSEDMAHIWKEAGVNRVSMGVQSLDDTELRRIGRRHDASGARLAYDILKNCFDNVSLDLMFGLPGQTIDSLRKTIEGFVSMRPEHISAYSLMYEERTAITRMRDSGKIQETEEDISVEMFRMVNRMLAEAGYVRYEISNYALLGKEARHNSAYWAALPYIGIGPGAHSYDGRRRRRSNFPDYKEYIDNIEAGNLEDIAEFETLDDDELREEMIMTRLRTSKGLSLDEFRLRFGDDALLCLLKKLSPFLKSGNIEISLGYVRLLESGVMLSDEIISSLF